MDTGDERFSLISDRLAVEMSGLTNNEWKLFALLLMRIERKPYVISKTRDPRKNHFEFTYKKFRQYGIPESSYKLAKKGLIAKGFIKVDGKYNETMCKLLKW